MVGGAGEVKQVSPRRLPLHTDTPAAELHAVDGLQYVHALLASIKLPSGLDSSGNNSNKSAAAAAGIESWAAALHSSNGWDRHGVQHAAGALAVTGVSLSSTESAVQMQTQQQQQQQQQHEVCIAALERLHVRGAASAAGEVAEACVQEAGAEQQQQQQQQQAAGMQLDDALVLLCLASSQQQQPSSPACPTAAAAAAKATPAAPAEAKYAALHATLQRYLCITHSTAGSTSQHAQRQQQQQPKRRARGVRLLCIQAIAAVVAERQAWCDQQLQHMWACLKQVGVTQPVSVALFNGCAGRSVRLQCVSAVQ
jgi:hypothetical protein